MSTMREKGAIILLVLAVFSAAPAGAEPIDREKPRIAFTTKSNDVLVSAPPEVTGVPGTVTGTASDDVAGVKTIRVVFCASARPDGAGGYTCGGELTPPVDPVVQRNATITCSNQLRRSCTFSAAVPDTPGSYLVFATAEDGAGRNGSAAPVQIFVVGARPQL